MAIFAAVAGALGATVRVKCPHCGKVQVRARERKHYRCNACHKAFDVVHGDPRKASSGKRHGH